MQVKLDENGYWSGDYATVCTQDWGVEVESIPDEPDRLRQQCYRYEDGTWIFDEERYASIMSEKLEGELLELKQKMITQSRNSLKQYLQVHKLTSTCHGGIEKEYSITPEKQSYLAGMILTATMAAQAGVPYQPSWNASGESCTYDWTIEELQQLAMEIESVVRPLVSGQQQMEVSIREAASLEELESIDISFGGGGGTDGK